MWYAILGAVLLAGDQILKYWVVTHLAVGESAPFLPGFMQLTRLHNYGAAWSSFSGRTVKRRPRWRLNQTSIVCAGPGSLAMNAVRRWRLSASW